MNRRIVAVSVYDDRDNFLAGIGTICETAIATYGMANPFERERDIDIGDSHVGQEYTLSQPEEMSLIIKIGCREGLFLDPVYTGKAFYGMIHEHKHDPQGFGERIIFIHTGEPPSRRDDHADVLTHKRRKSKQPSNGAMLSGGFSGSESC